MNSPLKLLLASHVVLGILGIACLYAVLMDLLKKEAHPKFLKRASAWGTILLILSWLSGGYYYLKYYGAVVKAAIKAGKYPWAHSVFTESKEHVFLFLPFLALAITIILLAHGNELEKNQTLKKELKFLSGILVVVGVLITLSGAAISGGVR